jgi:hypothetical protein
MLSNDSDFDLTIRQQPDRARVAGGKEKGTLSLSSISLASDLPVGCEHVPVLPSSHRKVGWLGLDWHGLARDLDWDWNWNWDSDSDSNWIPILILTLTRSLSWADDSRFLVNLRPNRPVYRAQTHRSSADRPAPGATRGLLLSAVSGSHCNQCLSDRPHSPPLRADSGVGGGDVRDCASVCEHCG